MTPIAHNEKQKKPMEKINTVLVKTSKPLGNWDDAPWDETKEMPLGQAVSEGRHVLLLHEGQEIWQKAESVENTLNAPDWSVV
jgi:hypothetical protein